MLSIKFMKPFEKGKCSFAKTSSYIADIAAAILQFKIEVSLSYDARVFSNLLPLRHLPDSYPLGIIV